MRRIENTPEQQESTRRRYEAGDPLAAIARDLGMAERTLRDRIKEWGWPPRTRSGVAPAPAVDRAALTALVRQAVEQELAKVERLLAGNGRSGGLGGPARTLATLVKTLAELRRLEAAAPTAGAAEEDDGAYGDLDALRRELARRIAGLREQRAE